MLPILAAMAAMAQIASAQEGMPPAISTDRPGQSTPPSILMPGYAQIEAGAQMAGTAAGEESGATGMKIYSIPSALVRIGLLPTMELRLGAEYRSVRTTQETSGLDATVGGIASLSIGTKIGITPENGSLPETAFLLILGLPYGDESFRPASVAPAFLLAMRSSLGGSLDLYYNLGASWDGSNGAGTGLYTLALSASLADDLSGFAELYGSLASGALPAHAADAGLAYVIAPNLQIDLYGGAGITAMAPDYFINAGVSLRLPR